LAPDSDQIDILVDTIASLQLSTQDGSFVFESSSSSNEFPSLTSVRSTGFDSIKTLPFSVWLPQPSPVKQQNNQRLSMVTHILSLPINAYLASSSNNCKLFKTPNQPIHRLPMVNHLFCMPISAFKSSSNTSLSAKIKL
jgi:hypothetical protein